MRICIHRGSKQIGGSCVEIEYQGQRLLIDLGLPLDAESNDSRYLPAIQALDGNDPSLLGILISHPHLDHFGLLAHISPNIPIGMGVCPPYIGSGCAFPSWKLTNSGIWLGLPIASGICNRPFQNNPFFSGSFRL